MRIRTTKTKNGRLFYVIKTYYDTNGKEHSITVEKLGNENDIKEKTGRNPDEWAREYVTSLNEQEKNDQKPLVVSFSRSTLISKNHQYSFNIGYLFLQSLYHLLGLDNICKTIQRKYQFDYNLNEILSRLIYGRILHPCSKLATCCYAKTLFEQASFSEHQIYRALDVLAAESDYIQEALFRNSFSFGKRKTGVIYYDCTNFFFEIETADENGLRQYGKGKENRPLPIVEMGMFIDSEGIPLAVCIHPGNTNEQITLKPLEQKIISNYPLSKFVVCTDAGLASKANRRFNDLQERAFVTTQSIKKLKSYLKEWALNADGWLKYGSNSSKKHNISTLDPDIDMDTIFFKERWVDQGSFEEKIIVTFSLKYQIYQRKIRASQLERAQRAVEQPSVKIGKKNQNDYRRFIKKISATDQGEIASHHTYAIDEACVQQEEQYDGFYAVVTDLDDDPYKIIQINKERWKIEECFRIMKTEFESRPVYLTNDNRIEAHFLTCFLSLVVYKYLEKMTNYQYTCEQLIDTLKDMQVREIVGEGYIPSYTRTSITDNLHEIFGFRTDYQAISKDDMKKILKITKSKIRHAK